MRAFAPAFNFVRNLVQSGNLPGAVFGVSNAVGHTEIQAFGPGIRDDSVYYLWSIIKPVVGLAFMQLIERGLVNLQHEVKHYLPNFGVNRNDAVQIWHLLTHTNGICEPSINALAARGRPLHTYLAQAGMNFRAGRYKQYSNLGLAALQAILETVTGLPLEVYLQRHVFEPLGMKASSMAAHERVPPGSFTMHGAQDVGLDFESVMRLKSPAAGLFSTAADLLRLGQCLLNGGTLGQARIIGRTTLHEMTRPQTAGLPTLIPTDWINDYDVGLTFMMPTRRKTILQRDIYGHHGWGGCKFWVYPHQGVCFVLLTNLLSPETHGADVDQLHNAFSACL